jgi:choline dehydrogenase-like flavoprotein
MVRILLLGPLHDSMEALGESSDQMGRRLLPALVALVEPSTKTQSRWAQGPSTQNNAQAPAAMVATLRKQVQTGKVAEATLQERKLRQPAALVERTAAIKAAAEAEVRATGLMVRKASEEAADQPATTVVRRRREQQEHQGLRIPAGAVAAVAAAVGQTQHHPVGTVEMGAQAVLGSLK